MKSIWTLLPPYHHEFVISNGRVLIGKVSQPKSLWCRNISQNFRGIFAHKMKRLRCPHLWNACTGILGCNWYKKYMSSQPVIFTSFFRGNEVAVATEVSFQRWRKLPFEFLNMFLEIFLVRARHFVCYAYNHPVFIILWMLFFLAQRKSLQLT